MLCGITAQYLHAKILDVFAFTFFFVWRLAVIWTGLYTETGKVKQSMLRGMTVHHRPYENCGCGNFYAFFEAGLTGLVKLTLWGMVIQISWMPSLLHFFLMKTSCQLSQHELLFLVQLLVLLVQQVRQLIVISCHDPQHELVLSLKLARLNRLKTESNFMNPAKSFRSTNFYNLSKA